MGAPVPIVVSVATSTFGGASGCHTKVLCVTPRPRSRSFPQLVIRGALGSARRGNGRVGCKRSSVVIRCRGSNRGGLAHRPLHQHQVIVLKPCDRRLCRLRFLCAAATRPVVVIGSASGSTSFVTDWLIYGNTRLARLFYPLPRAQPARAQSICMKLAYGVKFGAS